MFQFHRTLAHFELAKIDFFGILVRGCKIQSTNLALYGVWTRCIGQCILATHQTMLCVPGNAMQCNAFHFMEWFCFLHQFNMLGSVAEQDWWMVSGQDALANASWPQTMQCMKCMALHCIALHCNAMHFMHWMVCCKDALANASCLDIIFRRNEFWPVQNVQVF